MATAAIAVFALDPAPPPRPVVALLDYLDQKSTTSTWLTGPGLDPALVDRLFITGHEVAVFAYDLQDVAAQAARLRAREIPVAGALVAPVARGPDGPHDFWLAARASGLTYLLLGQ